MHNFIEYIKKHPIIVISVIAGVILLWLLYRTLKGASGAAQQVIQPQVAPYAPASTPLGTMTPSPAPANVSTTTTTGDSIYSPTTSTTTSSYQSTSSVYSPTSSYSTQNSQSTVGPVNTSSYTGPVTTTTTGPTTTNTTYNNPQYGVSSFPNGFAGVAGVSASPLISPVTPVSLPATLVMPANNLATNVKAAAQVPVTYGQPLFGGAPQNQGVGPGIFSAPLVNLGPANSTAPILPPGSSAAVVATGGFSPFPGGQY